MRLFLAIALSDEMRGALVGAQNDLYDRGVRGSYAPEENLHLTLAFIGEYPDPEQVLDALSDLSFSPFPLELDGMGFFGDLWWAGMRPSAPLDALVRAIRHALADAGIPFDRKRFLPHVTLIRRAVGRMPGIRIEQAGMTVGRVTLMRSDRGRNGMIYTPVGFLHADTSETDAE